MGVWRTETWQTALVRATQRFRSVSDGPIVLRYDPAVDPLESALFRIACRQQAAVVEAALRVRLRPPWRVYSPRLSVYLFRTAAEVSRVYGGPATGFASWDHWLVVVNLEAEWEELLRHEIAHILSGRWNPWPARVLCEGLAVWAQRTRNGMLVDDCARRVLLGTGTALDCLLGPEPDSNTWERERYYILAGSFTGALLRRYGWTAYLRLYRDRAATRTALPRSFARHFGTPLSVATRQWLADLAARPSGQIPLSRLLGGTGSGTGRRSSR